jgi:hypothetical protein
VAIAKLRNAALALEPIDVPVSQELVVDTVDAGQIRSAKWLVTLTDETNDLFNVAEILAIQNGVNVTFTVSNKVGDFLPYRTTVVLNGTDFQCKIANNHTADLRVDLVRISTLI